jgi:hypothetical protein
MRNREMSVNHLTDSESRNILFDNKSEKLDGQLIKFKVNSVDMFLLKLKKLSFITEMLSDRRNEFGFKSIMDDFRDCLFCEILD